jgi:endonuclease/exonuclease/phosphatase family metal-dependent hydrolase
MKKSRVLGMLFSLLGSNMAFSSDLDPIEKDLRTLKIMTLNIWGGNVKEPLLNFVSSQKDIDIICVQEAYKGASAKVCTNDDPVSLDIFSEIHALLPNHHAYFRPVVDNVYGIGMFVKKGLEVLGEGETKIYVNPTYPGRGPTHSRILQWVKCKVEDQLCTIVNVHGLWNGNGKTDTPERILQSKNIITFLDSVDTPKILCGDFNLRPDTESVKLLEHNMLNLIRHYNITSTRTSLYTKPEKYADYVFTSPDIKTTTFKVLEDEVSDHSPIVAHFAINSR